MDLEEKIAEEQQYFKGQLRVPTLTGRRAVL